MDTIKQLLAASRMAKTPCRVDMLHILLDSESALTEIEIKHKLSYDYDRATIFRNLRAFLKTGLLHTIALEGGEVRYQVSTPRMQSHVHAHFHCKSCSNLYCLHAVSLDKLNLPEGFEAEDFDLVVKGFCEKCKPEKAKNTNLSN
jgi:Fur family transcriptional regulator, ferric uptake regulator